MFSARFAHPSPLKALAAPGAPTENSHTLLISPSISYGEQDYDNLNSFANFTKKREDRPLRATLTVTIRALEKVIGYAPTLSVSYVRHRSNVDAFDYTRWSPVFEVGINVLSF